MNNPKIRFSNNKYNNFSDWKKQTVLDVFNVVKDRKQIDRTVLTIKQGVGTIPRDESGIDISATQSSIDNYKPVKKNDFVIHLRSFQGGFEIANSDGILSAAYTILRNKDEISPLFFKNYFRLPIFIHKKLRFAVEGIRDGKTVNVSLLKDVEIYTPTIEEQQKIAAFFTALDEKISIATKKLIQFKNLKKEIARSLFEDCAAEDFKKIGDFARTFAGATPSTSHKEYWENGTIPWMSSGEINNRYIHSVEKRITALGFDKTSTKWVKKGSTLVALAGQGKTRGKVAFTEMELCTNQSLAAIECDREEVNDKYLFFFLETQYENLRAQSTGDGGRGGLNLFIINNFEVPILPLHEQVRIVSILELIDKKIELAENKLLVLEQVKRAFMQQMFV